MQCMYVMKQYKKRKKTNPKGEEKLPGDPKSYIQNVGSQRSLFIRQDKKS